MEGKYKNLCCSGFLARGCGSEPDTNQYVNKDLCNDKCTKLNSYNWLKDITPAPSEPMFDCVEVRFKNSRKEFFRINTDYEIIEGDIVAVESSPGHDIGIVSLTGESARVQMQKKNLDPGRMELRSVYRKARISDIEKWIESVEREEDGMYRSRQAANNLRLDMKISDVEFQGDGTKAIFYYTANERVDFRELIKKLAEMFRVRIEMRQIGVRQEASRLGGIGSCGRELCCSTWLTNFKSVTTQCARIQQLALNPQKLAGQCSKLKCCINYEYDVYKDALKDFPDARIILKTKKGNGVYQKSDVFKQILWYAYENDHTIMAIPVDKVKKIINMNNKGKYPEKLENFAEVQERKTDYENPLDQTDIERFDDLK
jgi:cell fate regulator YaaT (PSP1 superfamily)